MMSLPADAKKAVFTFSCEADGEQKASQICSGGPYEVGVTQMAVLVAENGDNFDFNDAMVNVMAK